MPTPTPEDATTRSKRAPAVLAIAGAVLCAVSLLDPERALLGWPGVALSAAAVWVGRRRAAGRLGVAGLLSLAFALAAACEPEFRADSANYFAYLRSAAFDGDLDMDDEFAHWGFDPLPRTRVGRAQNSQSIGPAVLWSPFYAVAHVYVVSGLGGSHPADGYSAPYRRAAALGTITAVVLAAVLLGRLLAARHGAAVAALAIVAVTCGTSLAYYTLVVPTMAHGAAFASVCLHLHLLERARARPDVRRWALLGASLGVAMLFRHQALVLALVSAPTAVGLARARRLPPLAIPAAALGGVLAFLPQMAAWRYLFGSWLTQPQGGSFMDWSSPHLVETLMSADRGLLTWTPLAAAGLFGLVLRLRDRRDRALAAGACLAFAATAWVNGAVDDWAASDAFGGRRYDLVLPLLAFGLAALVAASAAFVARRPLWAPAAALAGLVTWNAGFITVFRTGAYPEAAPLASVAGDQAGLLQRLAERALGAAFGARGRAFAYDVFRAEYFYTRYNPGGTIAPAGDRAERYLLRGWAKPGRRPEGPAFRWAMAPSACVRVPLQAPFDMEIAVVAFAPSGASPQTMTVAVNGTEVGAAELTPEWSEPRFQIPGVRLVPGENELCLRFRRALPQENGVSIAAGVARIQLP